MDQGFDVVGWTMERVYEGCEIGAVGIGEEAQAVGSANL